MGAGTGRGTAHGRSPLRRQEIDGLVEVDRVVPPTVVPVQHRSGRTVGLLVTDADGTRWQRTVDLEGLARLAIVGAAVVGVAAATRLPSARVDRLSMGPGGWVSFRGFPAPKAERRPWWAVLLGARRFT
jgi:hypothetical protein